jgi:hypothetical protein
MDWPRTLAWWQIIGCAMGLLAFVGQVSGPSIGSVVIFGAVFGGISVMAMRAGVDILRGTPNARRLSIATQALQLVWFSFGNFVYQLALAPYVVLWYGFERSVKLNLGWTGVSSCSLAQQSTPTSSLR